MPDVSFQELRELLPPTGAKCLLDQDAANALRKQLKDMHDGQTVAPGELKGPFLREVNALDIPLTQVDPTVTLNSAGKEDTASQPTEPNGPPPKKLKQEPPLSAAMFSQNLSMVKTLTKMHFTAKTPVVEQWRVNAFVEQKLPEAPPDFTKNVKRWWVAAGFAETLASRVPDSKLTLKSPPEVDAQSAISLLGRLLQKNRGRSDRNSGSLETTRNIHNF